MHAVPQQVHLIRALLASTREVPGLICSVEVIESKPWTLTSGKLCGAGVRARQEGVVFVMCEDEELVERSVRPMLGTWVTLDASAASVTLQAAEKGGHQKQSASSGADDAKPAAAAKPSAIKMVRILGDRRRRIHTRRRRIF